MWCRPSDGEAVAVADHVLLKRAPDARRPTPRGPQEGRVGAVHHRDRHGLQHRRKVAAGYLPGGKRPAGWKYENKAGKVTATKKQAKVTFTLAQ